MVTNCRGNPPAMAGLPILRAATGGRPYNNLFGSGLSGLGISQHDGDPVAIGCRGLFEGVLDFLQRYPVLN
jgi:hypothetical protein